MSYPDWSAEIEDAKNDSYDDRPTRRELEAEARAEENEDGDEEENEDGDEEDNNDCPSCQGTGEGYYATRCSSCRGTGIKRRRW